MGESGFNRKEKGAGSARRESATAGSRAGFRPGAGPSKTPSRALVRPTIRPAAPLQARSDSDADDAPPLARMGWQEAIAATVSGLRYELVDVERAQRGLLRITIDRIPGRTYTVGRGLNAVPDSGEAVTVEDCEAVTRQLQYVLEVEGLDYARLEVSSPGLDRPLKSAADFARFAGEQVEVMLKVPFKGRKRFRGELMAEAAGWRIVLAPTANVAAAKRHAASRSAQAKAALAAPGAVAEPTTEEVKVLDFSLDEVRDARLIPVIDFKGRRFATDAASEETDGGRIQ